MLSTPLHVTVSHPAGPAAGAQAPKAPDELTLRAIQLQQALFEAGRPFRQAAALEQGIFLGDFERQDDAARDTATALTSPPSTKWVDVAIGPRGEVVGLAEQSFAALLDGPLASAHVDHLKQAIAAAAQRQQENKRRGITSSNDGPIVKEISVESLTQVSVHKRHVDQPHEAQVHTTRRETHKIHSPYGDLDTPFEQRVAAMIAKSNVLPSPIPPADAVLNSPLKKKMAEVQRASFAEGAGGNAQGKPVAKVAHVDPFAITSSTDVKRNWDHVKSPCSFKSISCSSVDEAKWALSQQGSAYAHVLVPFSSPPIYDWIRVNSGHEDPDSVAGKVTKKCHVGSFSRLVCGSSRNVWGISQDSLDNGRCVARVGFNEDSPCGTDWLDVSAGILPPPPSAHDRATSMVIGNESAVHHSEHPRKFLDISVGADGSVWAVIIASAGDADDRSPATSVWIRRGARGTNIGTHWEPLAIACADFSLVRPFQKSSKDPFYRVFRVAHSSFANVVALVALTPQQFSDETGELFERCGISEHDPTGTCWRKVILDAAPLFSPLTAPASLTDDVAPAQFVQQPPLLIRVSVASDGAVWAVDRNRSLIDCTDARRRATAVSSNHIIHDRYPGVESFRDTTIDGELHEACRADFTPLILRVQREISQAGTAAAVPLTDDDWAFIANVRSLLDVATLKAVFGDFDISLQHNNSELGERQLVAVALEALQAPSTGDPYYVLHLRWTPHSDRAAVAISIQTRPLAVFDNALLTMIVAQVAETTSWKWSVAAPLSTSLSTVTSGGLHCGDGFDAISRVLGTDIVMQLNAPDSSATLQPPLSQWLQLDDRATILSAARSSAVGEGIAIDVTVHRDICSSEGEFERLNLLHPSFRKLRGLQFKRVGMRLKLPMCGAFRDVTLTAAGSLTSPSMSCAIFSSDFSWSSKFGVVERSSYARAPLSSLVAPTFDSYQQRPDNSTFGEFSSDAAITSVAGTENTHYRPLVNAIDLFERACLTVLSASIVGLCVANDSALLFPYEERFAYDFEKASKASAHYRNSKALEDHLVSTEQYVLVHRGLSFVSEVSRDALERLVLVAYQGNGNVVPPTSNARKTFFDFVRQAFFFPSESIIPALLMSSNVTTNQLASNSVVGITFEAGTCMGFDLLAQVNDTVARSCQNTIAHSEALSLVQLEILSPTLEIAVESTLPSPAHSYNHPQRCATGPCGDHVKVTSIVVKGQLRFDVEQLKAAVNVRPNENVEDDEGDDHKYLTYRLKQWVASLPPTFSADGAINLDDVATEGSDAFLSFVGQTDILNWLSPGNTGEGVVMTRPKVRAVLRVHTPAKHPIGQSQPLSSVLEVVSLELFGSAAIEGVLFEHAVVHFPVVTGMSPSSFADVIGPSIVSGQRKRVSFAEVTRGIREINRADSHVREVAKNVATLESILGHCWFLDVRMYATADCSLPHPCLPAVSFSSEFKPKQGRFSRVLQDAERKPSEEKTAAVVLSSGQRIVIQQPRTTDDGEVDSQCAPLFVRRDASTGVVGLSPRDRHDPMDWIIERCSPGGAFAADSVLRHGDPVVIRNAFTGDLLSEEDGTSTLWHLHLSPKGDDGGEPTCWTPLEAGDHFTIVNGTSNHPFTLLSTSEWVAWPCVGPAPLLVDAAHALIFGRAAIASLEVENFGVPHEAEFPRTHSLQAAISGAFHEPLTFGERAVSRQCALAISDAHDHRAGCGFVVTVQEFAEAATPSAPSAECGDESLPPPPLTVLRQSVAFHLRNSVLRCMGSVMPITGTALADGIVGLRLGDSVLHFTASCVVPSVVEASDAYAAQHAHPIQSTNYHCDTHKASLHVRFAGEAVLEQSSMLVSPPPSGFGFPEDPSGRAGNSKYSHNADYSLLHLFGEVPCRGCVARIEETLRGLIRSKAHAACQVQGTLAAEAMRRCGELEGEIAVLEDQLNLLMDTHEQEVQVRSGESADEVTEVNSELRKALRSAATLREKAEKKPLKDHLYSYKVLLTEEDIANTHVKLAQANVVNTAQIQLLASSQAEMIALSTTIAERTSLLRSERKVLDTALLFKDRLAELLTLAKLDEAVGWRLREFRFLGNVTPTAAPSTMLTAEAIFDVALGSSGRLVEDPLAAAPLVSSLRHLLTEGDHDGIASQAQLLYGSQQHRGSQTTETKTVLLPIQTLDVCCPSACPLESFRRFVEVLLQPLAERIAADFGISEHLERRAGLSEGDVRYLLAHQ